MGTLSLEQRRDSHALLKSFVARAVGLFPAAGWRLYVAQDGPIWMAAIHDSAGRVGNYCGHALVTSGDTPSEAKFNLATMIAITIREHA